MTIERDVLQLSAVDQAALVRAGEVSARELVEASLAAIERLDPHLNAFVSLCPERAVAEAGAVKPGDERPLCGVPVGIKDLLSATEGLPTTEGSAAFGDWIADHDSVHVRRLREAGAIVVGKTNSPELGLRPVTENARYGVTRNPWDPELSPGGSSGGSAAAVASGMVALADASDLGGSIRIPAACCGLVGLKPSLGRVSIGPDFGDVGAGTPADCALTRTVMDTAVALDAIAGHEPGERHHAPAPATSFAAAAGTTPGRLRVRLCLDAPFGVPVDEEPAVAATAAARALEKLGHQVIEGAPAWDDDSFGSSWSTFAAGTCQHLVRVVERLHGRPVDPEQLEPATRAWLVDAPPVPLVDYLEAAERLWAFGRRIQTGWAQDDVLLTPTLTRLPAPAGGMQSQAGVTSDAGRFSAFVRIWNVTGQPAMSLPFAETDAGVPVGVQLVAAYGRDDLLLSVAAQLEADAGWRPAGRPRVAG
ncbi:MAG TPA: amidase [Gaiellales bacterium]|nr:amidase [Gaiellales bacterium]